MWTETKKQNMKWEQLNPKIQVEKLQSIVFTTAYLPHIAAKWCILTPTGLIIEHILYRIKRNRKTYEQQNVKKV